MGRLYDKLLSLLNISGRDLVVFLLALLLAFSIWMIHNLSLKYNAYLDVPVQAKCSLDGHSEMSADRANVIARCRATGYNVIRSSGRGNRRGAVVTFHPSVMRHKADDVFYVLSSDLQEYAHVIFGDGVTVEYFTTDTLFFRFPFENSRRVPVVPVCSISYQNQYMDMGPVEVAPDSVTIYGETSLLDNVTSVYTRPVKASNISSDIQGVVPLEKIRGVRFSEDKVHYSLKVARFVEMRKILPVKVVNLPQDKMVTVIPSNVEVSFRCNFPLQKEALDNAELAIDYVDYLGSLNGRCAVELYGVAKGVIDYDVDPSYVECIVEDRL